MDWMLSTIFKLSLYSIKCGSDGDCSMFESHGIRLSQATTRTSKWSRPFASVNEITMAIWKIKTSVIAKNARKILLSTVMHWNGKARAAFEFRLQRNKRSLMWECTATIKLNVDTWQWIRGKWGGLTIRRPLNWTSHKLKRTSKWSKSTFNTKQTHIPAEWRTTKFENSNVKQRKFKLSTINLHYRMQAPARWRCWTKSSTWLWWCVLATCCVLRGGWCDATQYIEWAKAFRVTHGSGEWNTIVESFLANWLSLKLKS